MIGQEIQRLAERAAREAGAVLMEHFGSARVKQKASHNLVTQADLESEKTIAQSIRESFPGHRMILEEGESSGSDRDEHVWVVDPLDATNNYAHGVPHFSVSIAYASFGTVQTGVVYDPVREEMFMARRGGGATLNGKPIRVSENRELRDSLITTGFFYDRGVIVDRTLQAIRSLFDNNVRGIRRTGGAALDLCWVACGRFEGFFEYMLAPWDYAAGSLIVQEAGGICVDRSALPLNLTSGSVIASNNGVFDEFLRVVEWRRDNSG